MNRSMVLLGEPSLTFGHAQHAIDPRDGLTLFGPFSREIVNNITFGIIGTSQGIAYAKKWLQRIERPVYSLENDPARPFFPGFETAFDAKISIEALRTIEIDEKELSHYLNYKDSHQRVFKLVGLYANELIEYSKEEELPINCWLVIIPDEIYQYCRPTIEIPVTEATIREGIKDKSLRDHPVLYDFMEELQEPYKFEKHFHDQLKARILEHSVVTQVIRESTIAFREIKAPSGNLKRDLSKFESAIAWNLSTSLYYKAGGVPWKLRKVRDGVCYVGLVYKRVTQSMEANHACCAAQMFLDSGDGMVFRGNNGPWYNSEKGQYHLSAESAFDLLDRSLNSFHKKNGKYPRKMFIHGRSIFEDDEWQGFLEASKGKSDIIGVFIKDDGVFKLFREHQYPVLRGMMVPFNSSNAILFTRGYIPRIMTQLGLETPNPLSVRICRGNADLKIVCEDIMALTKLNYNACIYSDGKPVTLRFADMIGNVLTSGPIPQDSVLPFKHYI